jgi:hypothetical protein
MQKYIPLFLASTASLLGVERPPCVPPPPAVCYSSPVCNCQYCLGPVKPQGNAPVGPRTCNGDLLIEVAGLYWNSHQEGLEYAVSNQVKVNVDSATSILGANNLVRAKLENPKFDWNFGYKIGLGYTTTCDSWDLGVYWTSYKGHADSNIQELPENNQTLITLWSDAELTRNLIHNIAYEIHTNWHLDLDLIDLELGREYWTSPRMTLRPHVGLRIAFIDQNYHIDHFGGSWTAIGNQPNYVNEVELNNDFHGVGIRAGLNLRWHLGCGWGVYNNFAGSIVYGRFDVDHNETNRRTQTPFSKTKILETSEGLRAARPMLDLDLGIQWTALICDCKYGLTAMFGWEEHLFFHQNQMRRVRRLVSGQTIVNGNAGTIDNIYSQRRGNLDTQGWTFKLKFEF